MRVDGPTTSSIQQSEIDCRAALGVQDRCNTIVQGYRMSRITKGNALAAIRSHIPSPNGESDPAYLSAVGAYAARLDAYDEELASAARRGPGSRTETSGLHSPGPEPNSQDPARGMNQ